MILLYNENKKQYLWNALIVVGATYITLYIPLNLLLDLTEYSIFRIMYWTASLVFAGDIIVRYNRFKEEKSASNTPRTSFFTGWFMVDLLAAIPLAIIPWTGAFQLIQLLKLGRVVQFVHSFRQAEVRFSITLTVISIFFWSGLLIHLLCCGWMAVYGVDSTSDVITKYVSALYWTVTTLTAVGYGDIVPVTNLQRLYAMFVQLSGLAIFGYIIGNFVSILAKMDEVKARYVEQVELLTTAVKRRVLPQKLQKRILHYYAHLRDDKIGYDESAFLKSLPDSLRTKVALILKKDFIEGIPLFKNAGENFIVEIALKLELTMATPGDYIFKADDSGDEMFFIIGGSLDVLNKEEDKLITRLKEGEFFGEIALFKSIPRSATIKATSYCNLYKLKRETFNSVIENHPKIAAQIEQKAKSREERYFRD